jgi:hypothetical protein
VAQAQVTLSDPNELQLSASEFQALLESMQPYFAEDGIELMQVEQPTKLPTPLLPPMPTSVPTSWLAKGKVFRSSDVFSSTYVSLERALDQDLTPWMPAHPTLRRLQNEMQMLMYTHPVNEARSQARRPTVNSFWISGAGALDGTSTSIPSPPSASIQYAQDLSRPALLGDWQAWSEAWSALDAQTLAPLLAKVRSAQAGASEQHASHRQISLTLCSAFKSQTFCSGNVSAWSRFKRVFQPSATARRHAFMEQL